MNRWFVMTLVPTNYEVTYIPDVYRYDRIRFAVRQLRYASEIVRREEGGLS